MGDNTFSHCLSLSLSRSPSVCMCVCACMYLFLSQPPSFYLSSIKTLRNASLIEKKDEGDKMDALIFFLNLFERQVEERESQRDWSSKIYFIPK